MCSSSRVWCRALVGTLLVAVGATLELYDQLPNEEMVYQDSNEIDTAPMEGDPQMTRVSDLVLRKILTALQSRDAARRRSYTFRNQSNDNIVQRDLQELVKDPVYKRLTEYGSPFNSPHKPNPVQRPQQKWKIKKGKAIGSQMVCYFKLCAFRSPA